MPAIMIPEEPRFYKPESQEGAMFYALKEHLSDGYYVVHSLKNTRIKNNSFQDNEADFVIFHPDKGILVLEAKAGQVYYSDGYWRYANGEPMKRNGPFEQANDSMYGLMEAFDKFGLKHLKGKIKFISAVWFPSLDGTRADRLDFPLEADKALVIPKEALHDPEPYIERIFSYNVPGKQAFSTRLTPEEVKLVLCKIICPKLKITMSSDDLRDIREMVFLRLLDEQAAILDFLEEQSVAVINGAAGTGKTLIAMEKARRHAANGDKVLFLCYNRMLRDDLRQKNTSSNIDILDIAEMAAIYTGEIDYQGLNDAIYEKYDSGQFPYKHIIIDEGQDFGLDSIEEADILNTFYNITLMEEENGNSFYIFYDKLQAVLNGKLPHFIQEADFRLTLSRNCRNTENIAKTSLGPVQGRKPKMFEGAIAGTPAQFSFNSDEEDTIEKVDSAIANAKKNGFNDIVILSCTTEKKSILAPNIQEGRYKGKYTFTTVKKFKGLEADAIILVDVNGTTFNNNNVLTYYVGTSRAKFELYIITQLTKDDCIDILTGRFQLTLPIKNPKKKLIEKLNAFVLI